MIRRVLTAASALSLLLAIVLLALCGWSYRQAQFVELRPGRQTLAVRAEWGVCQLCWDTDFPVVDPHSQGWHSRTALAGRTLYPPGAASSLGVGWYAHRGPTAMLPAAPATLTFRVLTMTLWYPAVLFGLFGIPAATRAVRWNRQRRRSHDGRCLACGYDLRASAGRCPECGRPIAINVGDAT